MARIRTIKPEFWDSPDTAKASPWARLLFIAMWNWADDYGRGTANMKELEGFAFPNDTQFTDSSGNTVQFRDIVAEVSECFGVVFYEVSGRPYYAIPSWEEHQRNERRAKSSRHPSPEASSQVGVPTSEAVAEIPCNDTEVPGSSGPGTGEQGNRGTGDRRAKALPENWEPTDSHIKKAHDVGADVTHEAEQFRSHHLAKGSKFKDWDMAFHNWLGNSKKFSGSRQGNVIVDDRFKNPWKYA